MSPMTVTDAGTRSPRAERTRMVIADALLSLLEEGDLQPTATRIADRAGVSLRLIYHHFGDLEELFQVLAQREGYRMMQRVEPVPADLPFDERLQLFVDQRGRVLEWLTPVCRAAALHEPFSEALRAARDAGYALAEREIDRVFAAELDPLPPSERVAQVDALAAATGWSTWNALRVSGRSFDRARAAMHRLVRSVLVPATA
jgi:TetR/AcrR family transcriptional regulator of autoinduction and epiphytic fitness